MSKIFEISHCPGQARRGLVFAVAQRSMARTQGLFCTSPAIHRGWEEKGPLWPGGWCSAGFHMVSTRLGIVCLCYVLLFILLLLPFISYFVPVSSKLFLSQPMFFTFWPFNSLLHPTAGSRGSGQAAHGSECLSGSIKLGSNIPKPQHSFIWTSFIGTSTIIKLICQST